MRRTRESCRAGDAFFSERLEFSVRTICLTSAMGSAVVCDSIIALPFEALVMLKACAALAFALAPLLVLPEPPLELAPAPLLVLPEPKLAPAPEPPPKLPRLGDSSIGISYSPS